MPKSVSMKRLPVELVQRSIHDNLEHIRLQWCHRESPSASVVSICLLPSWLHSHILSAKAFSEKTSEKTSEKIGVTARTIENDVNCKYMNTRGSFHILNKQFANPCGVSSHKLMEQLKNVPSMFHQNFRCLKTKIPVSFWLTGIRFRRVPGGTRTHDIQNQKQVVESLGTPVFIGISAIFNFWFAAICARTDSVSINLLRSEMNHSCIHRPSSNDEPFSNLMQKYNFKL